MSYSIDRLDGTIPQCLDPAFHTLDRVNARNYDLSVDEETDKSRDTTELRNGPGAHT